MRRQAPPFRRGRVIDVADITPTLRRVIVEGDELREMGRAEPGGAVRLLLPAEPDRAVDLPVWNGNAYLAPDGSRPPIRTVTPLDQDRDDGRVAVEIVRHDGGLLTPWVDAVASGGEVAVSGPSRGYELDPALTSITYAGDETALPAIRQLVAATPQHIDVVTVIEILATSIPAPLPGHPRLDARWVHAAAADEPGTAIVAAVAESAWSDHARLWAAGEAAAMQRIRTDLFTRRQLPRSHAHVRGYWKQGRAAGDDT